MTVKTSIALASCNGQAHIADQLVSFANQTVTPDEIVVSDDRSTDETCEIVKRVAREYQLNVRLIQNQERLGVAKNFEQAIAACTGDIILVSDQDDVWDEAKIASVSQAFENNRSKMVVLNNQRIVDQQLQGEGHTRLDNLRSLGLTDIAFNTGCCTSLRKEFCDVALPIPSDVPHDVWINRLAGAYHARLILPEALQVSRRHGGNASASLTNSVDKPSKQSFLKSALKSSAAGAVNSEIMLLRTLLRRIETHTDWLLRQGFESHKVLEPMAERLGAFEYRKQILHAGRLRRVKLATTMLLKGGYGQFSGFKSYARDLLT